MASIDLFRKRIREGKDPWGGPSFQAWYTAESPWGPMAQYGSDVIAVLNELGYAWPPPRRTPAPTPAPAPAPTLPAVSSGPPVMDITPALRARLESIESTFAKLMPALEERFKSSENILKELQPKVTELTKLAEPMPEHVKARMYESIREDLEPMHRELQKQLDETFAKAGQAGTQYHQSEKRKLEESFKKDLSRARSDIELQAAFQNIEADIRNRDYTLKLYNNALGEMMTFLDVLGAERRSAEDTWRYAQEFNENLRRYEKGFAEEKRQFDITSGRQDYQFETEAALTRQSLKQRKGESRANLWGQTFGAIASPIAAFLGRG